MEEEESEEESEEELKEAPRRKVRKLTTEDFNSQGKRKNRKYNTFEFGGTDIVNRSKSLQVKRERLTLEEMSAPLKPVVEKSLTN